MIKKRFERSGQESGFTLVELLVVVVIMGVLAAIVVFAVGSVASRGQSSACDADKKAVETAEESYFAQNGTYASEPTLVPTYMRDLSTLWDINVTGAGPSASYSLVPEDPDGSGPSVPSCPASP